MVPTLTRTTRQVVLILQSRQVGGIADDFRLSSVGSAERTTFPTGQEGSVEDLGNLLCDADGCPVVSFGQSEMPVTKCFGCRRQEGRHEFLVWCMSQHWTVC